MPEPEDPEPDEDPDDSGGLTAEKSWPFIPKYIG